MFKLKEGQERGTNREMRKTISKMDDMTEAEYYSTDGHFAPLDVKGMIAEHLQDDEFAEHWAALTLERELRRAVIEERKKQNLTQRELAEKARLTQQQLSRLEVGSENSPSLFTMSKLLSALNLEVKVMPRSSHDSTPRA